MKQPYREPAAVPAPERGPRWSSFFSRLFVRFSLRVGYGLAALRRRERSERAERKRAAEFVAARSSIVARIQEAEEAGEIRGRDAALLAMLLGAGESLRYVETSLEDYRAARASGGRPKPLRPMPPPPPKSCPE